MRRLLYTLLLLFPLLAEARISIPGQVFRESRFAQAVAAAKTKKLPLVFLLTDEASTWGPCNKASLALINAFNQRGVVVYLNAKTSQRYSHLNPLTLAKFGAPELGKYIPKVVVSSPDQMKIWGSMKYESINKSSAEAFAGKMKRIAQGKSTQPTQSYSGQMKWASRASIGRSWSGSLQKIDGQNVVLQSSKGPINIPMAKLTPAAAEFAKKVMQQRGGARNTKTTNLTNPTGGGFTPLTKTSSTASDYFKPLTWTNKNNQSIVASLVSIKGNIMKVRLANGETRTCKLSELTPESVRQARQEAVHVR